jgi:hypothetical protein
MIHSQKVTFIGHQNVLFLTVLLFSTHLVPPETSDLLIRRQEISQRFCLNEINEQQLASICADKLQNESYDNHLYDIFITRAKLNTPGATVRVYAYGQQTEA